MIDIYYKIGYNIINKEDNGDDRMSDDKHNIEYLSDVTEKTTVSARVNSAVVEMYKESDIPISLVIESSLINFMKLEDDEKIKFLSENISDNVKKEDLKKPKDDWKKLLSKYLAPLSLTSAVTATLLAGTAIGAVSLIGGILGVIGPLKNFDKYYKK